MRRPSKAQWWLIWIGLGLAYFIIGINLGSSSPLDKQILVGLLAIALATLLVWTAYRTLGK